MWGGGAQKTIGNGATVLDSRLLFLIYVFSCTMSLAVAYEIPRTVMQAHPTIHPLQSLNYAFNIRVRTNLDLNMFSNVQ